MLSQKSVVAFALILIGLSVANAANQTVYKLELSDKKVKNVTKKTSPSDYVKYVHFKYYKNGRLTYIADGASTELWAQTGCNPHDKFAFIIHGWRQSCDDEWVPLLIAKLDTYRGGCMICVEYSSFAQDSYVRLFRQYTILTKIIGEKIAYLSGVGLSFPKTYMFGFSFGGQLATAVGRALGPGLIKEIDTCDMAGPGFDYRGSQIDHRSAAQNVQCIHTTRDKGTRYYNCHQNWRMGNCGYSQIASKDPPYGSHSLCVQFYLSAFEHDFFAVKMPDRCSSKNLAPFWPQNFKMGYMETRKYLVNGELFAQTGSVYPYNVIPNNGYLVEEPFNTIHNQKINDKPVLKILTKARKLVQRRLQSAALT